MTEYCYDGLYHYLWNMIDEGIQPTEGGKHDGFPHDITALAMARSHAQVQQ